MDVRIRATLSLTVTGSALEDGLAEYDELAVDGLLREVIDKAIAVDEIEVAVVEGPNSLEEYDTAQQTATIANS